MKYLIHFISILTSIALYYILQIVGSFIHFFVFGSGAGADKYELLIPILMVLVQIILVFISTKKINKLNKIDGILYLILYLLPIGLFLYHHFV